MSPSPPSPAEALFEDHPGRRLGLTVLLALAVALGLFLWMHWMIRAPEGPTDAGRRIAGVELVKPREEPDTPPEQLFSPDLQPPPPPAAPPSMALPNTPTINVPVLPIAAAEVGSIAVPLSAGASTRAGLSSAGAFAGFAGQGSGAGAGGTGTGQGFRGRPLIPLSTARPQMPDWACDRKIRGWVEVVFTVMPNGRVQNVKLVDADPRGVFEQAAIESVGNWIYEQSDRAREVKQRIPMNPEDCAFNFPR